jgi:hypothetical protein
MPLPAFDVSAMQFQCPTEETTPSGDGEVTMPNGSGYFPLQTNYKLFRRYYSQEQKGATLESYGFVSLTRPTSISAVSREETIGQITGFLNLRDGWDGYGGYSPSASVCEYARGVVARLASEFPELPSPEISPTSNGTLTLSWEAHRGDACIEIGDDKFSAYIRYEDHFIPIKGLSSELGVEELQLISTCLYQ